jgi:hypothetical protein
MCTRYMWPLLYGPLVVWATCFMTCLFYAFFCSNTPCRYTPLLNLCLLIFGVMSVVWLC